MEVVRSKPEHRWWLSAFLASRQIRLSWIVLAVVLVIPPESGLGVELCAWKNATGAPCPGCGLTRSGANLFRGRWRQALSFHPLGLIMHPILLGLGLLAAFPESVRRALAVRVAAWQRGIAVMLALVWVVFFAFGFGRWLAVVTGRIAFPTDWY
ncbi:MAG: DUF2752 domain-containing protein [Gemmataceae bacterium]|nr:DUF2752 domain-containing protein [Gemmataceae bacterium]